MRSPFLAFTMVALVAAGVFTASAFNYAKLEPRTLDIVIASDQNAYIAVETHDAQYACYVAYTSGRIDLTFDGGTSCASNGAGVNAYSTYHFHDVLKITNKGTKTIGKLWLNLTGDDDVMMATNTASGTMTTDSTYQNDWELTTNLAPGQTWYIGFKIDASNDAAQTWNRQLTIEARTTT